MGASMKDIKIRIRSVQSTMQITKAMELVASSKLRKAKESVERARPYFITLHNTLSDIAYSENDFSSPFIKEREAKKACYILIAGDRGLAGGYNSNVFKLFTAHSEKLEIPYCVVPVGKKAVEFCERRGIEIPRIIYASRMFPSATATSWRICWQTTSSGSVLIRSMSFTPSLYP